MIIELIGRTALFWKRDLPHSYHILLQGRTILSCMHQLPVDGKHIVMYMYNVWVLYAHCKS